jgi:hypothetical protein
MTQTITEPERWKASQDVQFSVVQLSGAVFVITRRCLGNGFNDDRTRNEWKLFLISSREREARDSDEIAGETQIGSKGGLSGGKSH